MPAALPTSEWVRWCGLIAKAKGLSVSLVGTPDTVRSNIRTAIIAAGIASQTIDYVESLGLVGGVPTRYVIKSSYNVRETYERMFGRDLITDAVI
jgi:hypothetical protein